jgi:hypothetical protein
MARAMAEEFMASVIVCRNKAASAALCHTFEELSMADMDDRGALEAMRLCWREHCCPSPRRFREYYDGHYLQSRVRETLALLSDRPSSYLDVGYGGLCDFSRGGLSSRGIEFGFSVPLARRPVLPEIPGLVWDDPERP